VKYGLIWITLIISSFFEFSYGRTAIKVGGYAFAPFVMVDANNQSSGISLDIIKALNEVQSKYDFKFVLTSPKRRYQSFDSGHFDMMLFESKDWGWKSFPAVFSNVYLNGGEVYIAKKINNRSQDYFDSLKNKRMVVMRGYHYKFANFNADEATLRKKYKSVIVNSNKAIIDLILTNRGDVGVVTKSFLNQCFLKDQSMKEKLLISKKYDQKYNHTVLLREKSLIKLAEVNNLLDELKEKGHLAKIWKKYGIK